MKTPQTTIDKARELCNKADNQGFCKIKTGLFLYTRAFSEVQALPKAIKYVVISCLMTHSEAILITGFDDKKLIDLI